MKRTFPVRTGLIALVIILIIAFFASCDNENEPQPMDEIGCITGISKVEGSTERVFLYCAHFREFLAGDTVSLGGREIFKYFKDHKFKAVSDCSECE
jgi:hypothetical protein